jgi:hypothetical protein
LLRRWCVALLLRRRLGEAVAVHRTFAPAWLGWGMARAGEALRVFDLLRDLAEE